MGSDLKPHVEKLHNCSASFVEDVRVIEKFKNETVWDGTVSIFDIEGHPTSKRCYAWSHEVDDSGKRKFIAVLHDGPVDSPEKAVRAAIVNEFKK